jgi:small subunit ribosomal protein S8
MATTDPIADMLTRIRNASLLKKKQVIIPTSRLKLEILKILKEEEYIRNFDIEKDNGIICVNLNGNLQKLIRVSKPGRRIYSTKNKIPTVLQGYGLVVLSTSRGVMTGDEARRKGLGGEILCKIW